VVTGEVFFSPQLKRMLGYGPDEMAPVLETWSAQHPPRRCAARDGLLEEHLQGQALALRGRVPAAQPQRRLPVGARPRPGLRTRRRRPPTRVVGMVQDITTRKQAEAELAPPPHHLEDLVEERTAALSIAKERPKPPTAPRAASWPT
jgi:PAS domain-containing protein